MCVLVLAAVARSNFSFFLIYVAGLLYESTKHALINITHEHTHNSTNNNVTQEQLQILTWHVLTYAGEYFSIKLCNWPVVHDPSVETSRQIARVASIALETRFISVLKTSA